MNKSMGEHLAAPNLVNVCIDKREYNDSGGRMYCSYCSLALEFHNEVELLMMMDEMMNRINYPQCAVGVRSYRENSPKAAARPEPVLGKEMLLRQRGVLATFLIHVQYRQYASWQGTVVWAERNIAQTFQSELELLKIIESVLTVSRQAVGV